MSARHVGENDVESARKRIANSGSEGDRGRSRQKRRVKGRKSLQPVSKKFVPGQSIKNVSRVEIIKVRIYIYKQRSRASVKMGVREEGRKMYDARTRKGSDREKEKEVKYMCVCLCVYMCE